MSGPAAWPTFLARIVCDVRPHLALADQTRRRRQAREKKSAGVLECVCVCEMWWKIALGRVFSVVYCIRLAVNDDEWNGNKQIHIVRASLLEGFAMRTVIRTTTTAPKRGWRIYARTHVYT